MNKHGSSAIQTLLYECIACREMLKDVIVFDIIHLDYMVFEIDEQIVVEGQL